MITKENNKKIIERNNQLDQLLEKIDHYLMHDFFQLLKIDYSCIWKSSFLDNYSLDDFLKIGVLESIKSFLTSDNYSCLNDSSLINENTITVTYHDYGNDARIYFIPYKSEYIIKQLTRLSDMRAFL